jgi:serine/threonine-protein kinase
MSGDDTPNGERSERSFSPSEWRRLEPLVDALLDTPPAQRSALLAELSGGDPDRRRELEQVLAECERSHPLLDQPAAARFAALVDDDAVRVSQVIAERYRITRKLRRGGMATVYLALDLRHGRDVALKVVRAELAASLGSERFLREIEIVAGLHHPHIVSLYDSGAADGVLFYVMPYEMGQSLRERLTRDGPLPIDDAVVIIRDVCDALAYAHERGIVHRDIKPDNVLLSGRHAMVTDFGVAKALSAAVGSDERPERTESPRAFTTAGVTLGTPAYMAPEQIAGDPRIDHRADIYAVGVMAYEILTGRPPFEGEESHEVLAGHLSRAPEPLATHRADVPPELDALVMRCLEKRAAARWQSADEVLSHLAGVETPSGGRSVPLPSDVAPAQATAIAPRPRSVFGRPAVRYAAVAALFLIVLFGAIRQWGVPARAVPTEPSIAVLPLANLSSDPADAAFADRMMEELISTLARGGSVRVIASNSVAGFRGHTMDVRTIADSLGVSSILEGGFGKIGSGLRMDVRLVDGRDGSIRWSQRYDREFRDILAVQDEIARAVAGELGLRFDKQKQLVRHKTKSIAAYELYLRGWDPVLLRNQAGIWKAQRLFEQAIAADSMYAAAHASLALMYVRRARTANDPEMPLNQLLALAEATARKAIALDDSLAEAHYALGQVLESTLDFPQAERETRLAVALDPSRSVYRRRLGYLKAWTGPPDAELAEARLALEVDPLNPYSIGAVASGLYGLHRYDEAMALDEGLLAMKPPLQGTSFALAQLYAKKQMWEKAIAMLRPQAEDGDPAFIGLLGHMLARAGQKAEANRILADLLARQERTSAGAFEIAMVYAGLGDRDQAFAWFDKSIDDYSISSMIMGPTFEDLHRDPRFAHLRARLGLK